MKIRRIDFSPDEFLVGIAGMPAEEIGVYWVICALLYSTGRSISINDERLKRLCGVSYQRLPGIIKSLVEKRAKLDLEGDQLSSKRVTDTLAAARRRVSSARANGELGGRPSMENNDIEEPGGLSDEKLTINHQPSTITTTITDAAPAAGVLPRKGDSDKTRGTRLPTDWQPTDDDKRFAAELGVDVAAAIAEFKDYWKGVPGQRGRKIDWDATFRNRCRELAGRRKQRQLPLLREAEAKQRNPTVDSAEYRERLRKAGAL